MIKKSEDDVKKEREDLWEKITQDIDISDAKIDQVLVKRDCEELFGLEISHRRGYEFNLYDFEIESFISLAAFKRISGLDTENFESCKAFFENHTLF